MIIELQYVLYYYLFIYLFINFVNKGNYIYRLVDKKAAIGYVYEDSTESPPHASKVSEDDDENEDKEEDDLSDLDLGKCSDAA